MFKIKFNPARFGDSIRIAYGSPDSPNLVLIDGGTAGTLADIREDLLSFSSSRPAVELAVVTHIDRDHIEGLLKLLEERPLGFDIREIWFNGWPHLPGNATDEQFGAVQGERLTAQILRHRLPWNAAFGNCAATIPDRGPLPVVALPGGLRLTLLNPNEAALARLKTAWETEVRAANLDPGFGLEPNDTTQMDEEVEEFAATELPDVAALAATNFQDDRSPANGSSIALLAEYDGKRALLAGDAPADSLIAALERYSPSCRLPLDLFKLSHHGSKNTTSRELVEKVKCPRFVFSTNGATFGHPDHEAVARVLFAGRAEQELWFNYRTSHNDLWGEDDLQQRYRYSARYPAAGKSGIEIDL
jgi:hypothetical protein